MSSVTLKNICKVYNKNIVAVDNFTMCIEDKEFIVLVGPSGCGKTTTLRMIAGLEEISSGELLIDNKVMNAVEPKDRDIAMVFQNYALYPHLTVFDNMAFGLRLRRLPKNEIIKRIEHTAAILGIEQYLKRKPRALSGGQRQRVAIGRAIVREPKVFLMDEPLSNLDAKLRNQMRAELIQLHKRLKTTFIYVTHDQTEAMTLGTRVVVMKDGIIQQIGTPNDVYTHPKNVFVAGFIGSPQMNFFFSRLSNGKDGYSISMRGRDFLLADGVQKALKKKDVGSCDIIIGFRPEDANLVPDEVEGIEAELDVAEMLGADTYLHINTDLEGAYGESQMILKVPSSKLVEKHNRLKFLPDIEKLHLFDRESQERII